MAKQVGRLAKFGKDVSWETDSASPNHPAHALLFERRKATATFQQNQQNERVNGKACQEGNLCDALGWVPEHVSKAQESKYSDCDREQRYRPLYFLPARLGSIIGESECEYQETGESGALSQGFRQLLSE